MGLCAYIRLHVYEKENTDAYRINCPVDIYFIRMCPGGRDLHRRHAHLVFFGIWYGWVASISLIIEKAGLLTDIQI